jgi:prepilin-type N-terminal cleavage/methylation domain-containing protein
MYIIHRIFFQKAFTLVELMIVIAIIGILAAALFPSMSNYIARANNRALIEEMRKIGMGANMFHMDFGRYSGDT